MGYLSLNIQMNGKLIIIVGGGKVAERKVSNILPSGAKLTVISPTLTFELQQLRDNGAISHLPQKYSSGDLNGAFMVIAATNDRETNRLVADEAINLSILAEITDSPSSGNVTSPAVIRQGDLTIAISTNNRAPSLAAAIKNELIPLFGDEYAKSINLLGAVREKLLTDRGGSTYNKQVLSDMSEKLPALFASNATEEIEKLLHKHLGEDFRLSVFFCETGDNQ
ncbi:MAG: bifunctional precorrin-2 dehydrogenase/sirohydrochlorin ferrochelatase [Geobacteraceae bacterium]|nr:bifunctional precorrin-2 dehydrogenase/sirohydrochlorin ferrochelatase [Geobacteraceae bacterium]